MVWQVSQVAGKPAAIWFGMSPPRVCALFESRPVAAVAGGVRGCEGIIVVHMAIGAGRDRGTGRGRHLVGASERPSGGAVVKLAVGPGDGVVASGAERSGELRGNVIGHEAAESLRTGPIGSMAPVAVRAGGGEVVVVVDVAKRAGGCGVCADECKSGDGMIEGALSVQVSGVVTSGTIRGGEGGASGGVGGIVGLLPGGEVAAGIAAISGSNLKIVIIVDVATGAGHIRVACGQTGSRCWCDRNWRRASCQNCGSPGNYRRRRRGQRWREAGWWCSANP